jgi:hypothetical protein
LKCPETWVKKIKKPQNNRKNYYRLRSGNGRLGLGYIHYQVLWRRMERIGKAAHPRSMITRALDKAMALTNRYHKQLWVVNPNIFYQSPFVPKPFTD